MKVEGRGPVGGRYDLDSYRRILDQYGMGDDTIVNVSGSLVTFNGDKKQERFSYRGKFSASQTKMEEQARKLIGEIK